MRRYSRLFESVQEIPEEVKLDIGNIMQTKKVVFQNPRYFWGPMDVADFIFETPGIFVEFRKEDPRLLLSQFKNRSTSSKVVDRYYAMLQQGIEFDPVLVSGDNFIDGGHRVEAYTRANKAIPVLDIKSIINHDWDKEVKATFGKNK